MKQNKDDYHLLGNTKSSLKGFNDISGSDGHIVTRAYLRFLPKVRMVMNSVHCNIHLCASLDDPAIDLYVLFQDPCNICNGRVLSQRFLYAHGQVFQLGQILPERIQ